MPTLGEVVRKRRKQQNWTQTELAQQAGITQQAVSDAERLNRAGRTVLLGLARAFKTSVDELLQAAGMGDLVQIAAMPTEGVPEWTLADLLHMWPDLTPEDRVAVVERTRVLWEQRQREQKSS
jgi:transcriptional regulator with XRE-family HTH domain